MTVSCPVDSAVALQLASFCTPQHNFGVSVLVALCLPKLWSLSWHFSCPVSWCPSFRHLAVCSLLNANGSCAVADARCVCTFPVLCSFCWSRLCEVCAADASRVSLTHGTLCLVLCSLLYLQPILELDLYSKHFFFYWTKKSNQRRNQSQCIINWVAEKDMYWLYIMTRSQSLLSSVCLSKLAETSVALDMKYFSKKHSGEVKNHPGSESLVARLCSRVQQPTVTTVIQERVHKNQNAPKIVTE